MIIAMAPPEPLGVKIFVALLMLGLVGILVRAVRGVSFRGRSIAVAGLAAVGVVVVLEAILPWGYGGGFHNRGLLAAIVGAGSGALLFQPTGQRGRSVTAQSRRLPMIALITGPVVGLALAILVVMFTEVEPQDRVETFRVFIILGFGAGMLGALIVAIAAVTGSVSGSDTEE